MTADALVSLPWQHIKLNSLRCLVERAQHFTLTITAHTIRQLLPSLEQPIAADLTITSTNTTPRDTQPIESTAADTSQFQAASRAARAHLRVVCVVVVTSSR